MGFIEGQDRAQVSLLPPSIEDYVAPDRLVRIVDAFVDGSGCLWKKRRYRSSSATSSGGERLRLGEANRDWQTRPY
jgi:hypothetical protein